MSLENKDLALKQLVDYGLEVQRLETTGKIVRCKHLRDKLGRKNGWYVAHDFVASSGRRLVVGSYGWWKDADGSQKITIPVNGSPITEEDHREIEVRQKQINEEVERERAKAAEAAAEKADEHWHKSKREGDHPYLRHKGVKNHGLRFSGEALLVPMHKRGVIVGLQSILEDGQKRFTTGMSKKGARFDIGIPDPGGIVAIVEGYATGATVHELTTWPVAVAFDVGNLLPVALEVKARYPDVRFVFCADDDYQTEGNPGLQYARKAAAEVGGLVIAPKFSVRDRGTDWNDLATIEGREEAARQLFASVPLSRAEILAAFSKCEKRTDAQRLLLGKVGTQLKTMADSLWEEVKLDIIDGGLLNERDLNRLRKDCDDLDTVEGWRKKLKKSENGKILAQRGNLLDILGNDPALTKAFALDTFTQKIRVMRKLPGMRVAPPEDGAFLEDDVSSILAVYLSRHYCDFPREQLADVITCIANHNAFNPLTRRLETCATKWDGVKRLDSWLSDLCGAEANDYTRTVGRLWMIQAVARAYEPGCKADCMLVIDGCQGARKSSFFDALSFGYFSDRVDDISGKDGVSGLIGKWIVEFAELDALHGKKQDTIKAYLSRRIDNARLPYERHTRQFSRSCVFVGTTNEDRYLTDLTGNRRYWPVKCKRLVASELAQIRDQLWGEAVLAHKANEKWWIDEDDEIAELFRAEQRERLEVDDRISMVAEYLEGVSDMMVSLTDVWVKALGGQPSHFKKGEQMVVGGLMRQAGWEKVVKWSDGKTRKGWAKC